MKKDKILNTDIISAISSAGHTQYFVIADAGLPIPNGVPIVDIALVKGIPSFMQTLEAVNTELVVESYILAEEIKCKNTDLKEAIIRK
ncbi:MAG: D-ribose pyranase [Spirochaetales bacterium]